jgi:DNA-binding MarR family transcriptional regulator
LRFSIESKQIEHDALLKEVESLKAINEESKSRNEQLKARIEELQASIGAINLSNEASKATIGAIQESDEFLKLVKEKANGVKKIRVNEKAIIPRIRRVFIEIAEKGSAHEFELCKNLDIPRSTMTRVLGILGKMNWIYLQGSHKFGSFVLTDEGKNVIEKFGVRGG